MQPITSELKNARERLLKETFHQQWDFRSLAEHMEQLCGLFPRTSREQHRALIAEFHNCAGRLPCVFDDDYGALLLESTADLTDDPLLRRWLYTEARFRAEWCAQAATAGGEGISRYQAVRRLNEKLQESD
jgi:hypothetical protein